MPSDWYVLNDGSNLDATDNIGDAPTLAYSSYVLKYDSANDVWRKAQKSANGGAFINHDCLAAGDILHIGHTAVLNRSMVLKTWNGSAWVAVPTTSLFTIEGMGSGGFWPVTAGNKTLQANLLNSENYLIWMTSDFDSYTLTIHGSVRAWNVPCIYNHSAICNIVVNGNVIGGIGLNCSCIELCSSSNITVGGYVQGGGHERACGIAVRECDGGATTIVVGSYVQGGTGTESAGIYIANSSGFTNVTVGTFVRGGSDWWANGIEVTQGCVANIVVGSHVQGGSGDSAHGIYHSGSGTIIIYGNLLLAATSDYYPTAIVGNIVDLTLAGGNSQYIEMRSGGDKVKFYKETALGSAFRNRWK